MKNLTILFVALIVISSANAQGCLPEGIIFSSQSQIDNFQADYPGCTAIEGNVKISGSDISNLTGLNVLTSIGGNLEIGSLGPDNPGLINLSGLNNLTFIGGTFVISSNDTLIDLSGLENLISIGGGLHVLDNLALTDISALENLNFIGGDIGISMNYYLASLTGLEGLTTIEGGVSIWYNQLLTDLSGFNSLTSIGGTLYIGENEALTSLEGLDNLTSIGGDLAIGPYPPGSETSSLNRNSSLTSLSGLNSLTSVGGNLCIYGNPALISLEALENLTSIGGSLGIGYLCCWGGSNDVNYINGNPSLTSLSGLENIDAGTINSLYIIGNSSLSTCDVQSICNYLASPNGSVDIYGNASGCNSVQGIANACGMALPCLPYGNYYLASQDDVDGFQADFPGCTDLVGNFRISGSDITNLNGLNVISSIEGYLMIGSTSLLSDLTGLGSLRFVRHGLIIYDNNLLTSLTGLDNLDSIGGTLGIYDNDSLTSLTGLENLNTIAGSLFLGVDLDWFTWYGNPVLSDISALENIEADSIKVMEIVHNPSLAECAITSICEILAGPGTALSINDNAPGCNSLEEVEAACGVGFEEVVSRQSSVLSYPNPFADFITIEYELEQSTITNLTICNQLGQQVAVLADEMQTAGKHQLKWNAEAMPAGVYFYRLVVGGQRSAVGGKIVIEQ